jgi:hypothetical protein
MREQARAGRMEPMLVYTPPFAASIGLYGLLRHLVERVRAPAWPPKPADDLRTCRFCGQPYVGPLDCRASGESEYRILLRCGNCDCRREVLVTSEQASAFERGVARDIVAINRALRELERERMAAQADAFAAALARGLIDASDFSH